ncbi:glycoside hydrolase family 2 protein [Mucilaginibacter myungsuensis]|uniref:Glycosyl hydrolase n=1 Tax=Mucilaginibacter myungsuensis TaxID=649104 RepID=A0A929KY48_9SPHI|nr:glycoside hydrolase family 2 TIM barrel-domain containing protein [Mucilaginibacter myungsuensis]MBE9660765.1 glycosyl hydrolase [Mucilaginibacter myungsuensis]MDN3600810.1 glycoside hydrolase family 2 TIM barrel-domain containing protein [Mucilaginibacter myungsuensis]
MKKRLLLVCCILLSLTGFAQDQYELNSGWLCKPRSQVSAGGQALSSTSYPLNDWKKARVPGTVLTTMLENGDIPDPFYGMNNKRIPDIYDVGREYYTYWFVKDFIEKPSGKQVWLKFRGINYSCDIFLNGKQVNSSPYQGMFMRKEFNITALLSKTGRNRLAVIVHPPDPVGNPNGGQGGDGTIAKNVGTQYTAGWDWIRPIRDRNTGIWDKVYITRTQDVHLTDPHVVTLVNGNTATVKVSADLQNTSSRSINGILSYTIAGRKVSKEVLLASNQSTELKLPDLLLKDPKLWWPAGYGDQSLYPLKVSFSHQGVSDSQTIKVGIRQIDTKWNATTNSREVYVNGKKIFIKGGNWIISDAMLRFSNARYDAEVRYHRDMNLNLIRVWGGALVERPEFYQACDKYGMLVFQDLWMSGDCNGRWDDPKKLESKEQRRKYPDDHQLWLASAADMIKMVRNHPSLAIWCGGNEITPPDDILKPLRDTILPALDGTRWFVDFSNSLEMSKNEKGINGDGPYGIQPLATFWDKRDYPFNSEVGSVGTGDMESLRRFIPEANLVVPQRKPDSVWDYHHYIAYDRFVDAYGKSADLADFTKKAQLVNYDQYRGLMEGYSSHMWDWYTGVIIWKTQNPWTALRGQMYDYYLDPNACLFGLRSGSEPLHVMYNAGNGAVMLVNNGFSAKQGLNLVVKSFDMQGKSTTLLEQACDVAETSHATITNIKQKVAELSAKKGSFLSLQLLDGKKKLLSHNFYWLPDEQGMYTGLNELPESRLSIKAKKIKSGQIRVTFTNPSGAAVSFFNRVSLLNGKTLQRILPVFYQDNYFSVEPGTTKIITIDYNPKVGEPMPNIRSEDHRGRVQTVIVTQ